MTELLLRIFLQHIAVVAFKGLPGVFCMRAGKRTKLNGIFRFFIRLSLVTRVFNDIPVPFLIVIQDLSVMAPVD
jgi:hypothetical protein